MTTKNELIQSIVDQGVTQADFLEFFGSDDQALIDEARVACASLSDIIEIDPFPLISKSHKGTWVSAWVYVENGEDKDDEDDTHCRECGEPCDNGEGWDGLCGNCADKLEELED